MAEEVAEVLLAYGAQSVAVEEFRPAGGAEQVGSGEARKRKSVGHSVSLCILGAMDVLAGRWT